jgi:hypothetical protein
MTKKLTTSAIMSALTLVFLFGSVYLPTGRIALLALTSMCILVTVIQCGVRYAWLQYAATALLALLLIPFKLQVFMYIIILGYYPMLKLHIENIKKIALEWIVKIAFFFALIIVMYFVINSVLLKYLSLGPIFDIVLANTVIVVIGALIVFVLYDCLLSFFARYFIRVISERIR